MSSNQVHDLGVYFSSHLTMELYKARVARTCFYHLCHQRSIRHSLGLTSPHGLFPPSWSRGWITATQYWHIYRLQRWHRSRDSSMLLLGCLWIWDHVITGHRRFTDCQLQRESSGRAPSYLTELVTSVADVPARTSLRSAGGNDLVVQQSRLVSSERFLLRHQELGTVCPLTLYW